MSDEKSGTFIIKFLLHLEVVGCFFTLLKLLQCLL